MRHFALLLIAILSVSGIIFAQESTPEPDVNANEQTASLVEEETPEYVLRVFVDSAFIRALPTRDSEMVGSTFQDESLLAIGRNADGAWFQVRRPYRQGAVGWISRTLVAYSFDIAELPITDLTTGVTGAEPVYDSGFSVFVLTEASLRTKPDPDAERVGIVPIMATIPAIERTADSLWLYVNYLGNAGWVAEFLVRSSADIAELPINQEFAPDVIALEIIPPEVQLAQVNRVRAFVTPLRDQSQELSNFWAILTTGETVPCNPPAGNHPHYGFSARDIVELPELRRQVRTMTRAVDDLNASIDAIQRCGIYTPSEISEAYAHAINSTILFNVLLSNMDNVEAIINQ
jgi:hypothetical protein